MSGRSVACRCRLRSGAPRGLAGHRADPGDPGVLLVAIAIRQPDFYDPPSLLAFLKRAAPLVILAAGQYFVIVAGRLRPVGRLAGHRRGGHRGPAHRRRPGDDLAGHRADGRLRAAGRPGQRADHHAAAGAVVHHHPRHVPDPRRRGLHLDRRLAARRADRGVPDARPAGHRGRARALGSCPTPCSCWPGVAVLAMLRRCGPTSARCCWPSATTRARPALSGARVARVRTIAFVLSGLFAAVAAILLGGFGGVSFQVGAGLEFTAITAVVLGGVVLGGGRGSVTGAMLGALTLEILFTLLNLLGVSGALKSAVQGLIIIAAVAVGQHPPPDLKRHCIARGIQRGRHRREDIHSARGDGSRGTLLYAPPAAPATCPARRPAPARARAPAPARQSKFFVQADYDRELALRTRSRRPGPRTSRGSRRWTRRWWTPPSTRRPGRTTCASPTPASATRGGRSASRTCRPRWRCTPRSRRSPSPTRRARTTSRSPTSPICSARAATP